VRAQRHGAEHEEQKRAGDEQEAVHQQKPESQLKPTRSSQRLVSNTKLNFNKINKY
jgi:hypothetical protein